MMELQTIDGKLSSFKRKYYLNLAVRGSLLTLSLTLFYFLVAAVVEYNFWLSGWARFGVFASFFALVAYCLYKFLKEPLAWWLYRKGLGQEESAKMIGSHFPHVRDRLLNLIQLNMVAQQTDLLRAGILQKSGQFERVSFEQAVDLRANRRYLSYFLPPFAIILLILIFNRGILTQSTKRIVEFNREFSPQAPFKFVIQNKALNAFFNEDFTLSLTLQGDAIPESVYLLSGNQRLKLETVKPGEFEYTFEKVQNEIPFQLQASGFFSMPYTLQLINRPELLRLKMTLEFPSYLGRKNDEIVNTGNAEVPEGTQISWQINTSHTQKAFAGFTSLPGREQMQSIDNESFKISRRFVSTDQYWIDLENEQSKNKDKIVYSVQVNKDQYPEIEVDHLKDSVLYRNIFLGGTVRDDFGLTALALNYQITRGSRVEDKKVDIALARNQVQQSFFYQWRLDSLNLQPGDKLTYYLQVWDNDGVNGHKSTKSSTYTFALPGEEELKNEIAQSQSSAQNKIDESLKKAQDMRKAIDEAQQKLKGKQVLDWQDKKMLEDMMNQKKDLDQMLNELQKQNEQLDQKKETLSDQDQKIREKAEKIQKLMDELLDPETKKLFEELEKLLNENPDMSQIQKMLEKMNRKEINLEKELERTLELFKQMKFDYKVEQAVQEIKQQKEKQEQLLEKTEERSGEKPSDQNSKSDKDSKSDSPDKNGDKKTNPDNKKEGDQKTDEKSSDNKQNSDNQDLAKDQGDRMNDVDKFQKEVDELNKMAEELKKETSSPSPEDMKELKDLQRQSKESLQQNNSKKSIEPQKKAVNKMSKMQQQLEGMQSSMEMNMDVQNLEALRQILHGLIKLSFDQEALMKDFNQVQQTDPRYVQLSENQLKIKDDNKVLEDSLLSLSKRDVFMASIVTREVGELDAHLDKAADHIRERRKPNAAGEMQLSMTSINNLALLLNDHYDMMMDMMANAMKVPGKGKPQSPSLGQLQQQLNQKIQDLKNGNKSGRQYSEALAKMAAEQERIRRALQELQEKLKNEGGKPLGNDIPGKMEQTEMDLVNKQITEMTIRRQKEIETRLLEAEKSMREQNMDKERKGETAKDYDKEIPKAFEEYLRLKEKEVELLKSMPPKLYPYYKKEVDEYFKRIRNRN
jgi:hypothetical protein